MKDPREAVKTLVKRRSFKAACAGYFAATLGWVIFFNAGDGLSVPALVFKLAAVFAAELTAGYFIAALCGLFLDFRRVQTSPAELFCLVGSAGFIKGLLIAGAVVSAAVPAARLYWFAPFWLVLTFALQLGYLTRALMRAYDLKAFPALGAWLFGFVPVCAAGILGIVFFFWGITLLF